jgi:hypothetical protein
MDLIAQAKVSDARLFRVSVVKVAQTITRWRYLIPIGGWTAHDLRRTACTHMAMLGVSPLIIGQVVNHRGTTRSTVTLSGQAVMASWQEIGRRICDGYLNPGLRTKEVEACLGNEEAEALIPQMRQAIDEMDNLVRRTLEKNILSNPLVLIACLRSGRPLSPDDRERIAQALEKAAYHKPARGRPHDERLYQAAHLALAIYHQRKIENIAVGINNRGLGRQMKDRSCDYAIEILAIAGGPPPASESVREMMERPISRRK